MMNRRAFTMALALTSMVLLSANAHALPIAGTTSGVFSNPVGAAGAPPFYTGVGTDQFGWGDPDGFGTGPNFLRFDGTSFSTSTGTPFGVGSMTYYNGTVVLGTEATGVDLNVTVAFTLPSGINQTFAFPLTIITTPNVGNQQQDADILQLPGAPSPQTFTYGGITYNVELTGFSITNLGGFVDAAGWHVYEGERGTADLMARVSPVPEPASLLLLGSGLVSLVLRRRRA